jgi:hypothetical protein
VSRRQQKMKKESMRTKEGDLALGRDSAQASRTNASDMCHKSHEQRVIATEPSIATSRAWREGGKEGIPLTAMQ